MALRFTIRISQYSLKKGLISIGFTWMYLTGIFKREEKNHASRPPRPQNDSDTVFVTG